MPSSATHSNARPGSASAVGPHHPTASCAGTAATQCGERRSGFAFQRPKSVASCGQRDCHASAPSPFAMACAWRRLCSHARAGRRARRPDLRRNPDPARDRCKPGRNRLPHRRRHLRREPASRPCVRSARRAAHRRACRLRGCRRRRSRAHDRERRRPRAAGNLDHRHGESVPRQHDDHRRRRNRRRRHPFRRHGMAIAARPARDRQPRGQRRRHRHRAARRAGRTEAQVNTRVSANTAATSGGGVDINGETWMLAGPTALSPR